jgi:hypothetical protein
MSDQDTATEEEKLLAPLHIDLEVEINGVRIASRCFVRQADWEAIEDDEARKQQIRSGIGEMTESLVRLIEQRNLLHPESSSATV